MKTKSKIWTTISSKEVYKNPWIRVQEDRVIGPNKTKGIFGIVSMKFGVSILPIDERGNIYLVEQYRYAMKKKTIEVVTGGIDKGEKPLQAAKRELLEETGIKALSWEALGYVNPLTSVTSAENYLFIVKGLSFMKAKPEKTEKIRIMKVSFKKAREMIETGIITHSTSMTLILLALEKLRLSEVG